MRGLARSALLLLLWLCAAIPAQAHKASDAYLLLGPGAAPAQATHLQLSLALKDLDAAIDSLDANDDRSLTWGEIRAAMPELLRWVAAGVQLRCDTRLLSGEWVFESLEKRSDGTYARLGREAICTATQALAIDYSLFKSIDATHRVLVSGVWGGQPIARVLAPQNSPSLQLNAQHASVNGSNSATTLGAFTAGTGLVMSAQSGPATLAHFFPEGLHHILTGYDHLAFLLALLLPIALFRKTQPAGEGQGGRSGLAALLLTVTGFTLGHSCTLALATFGVISASPAWVEPAIALTIAASAALNLYPLRWVRSDALALAFGLIHGLGFSGVMTEAGISGSLLVWGLAGFNLGVEAGQLAVVALWCVLHYALQNWKHYTHVVVRGGSWALVVLALYWMLQRL